MKKRLLAFITVVFTLICMALPAYYNTITTQVGRTVGTSIIER